MSAKKSFLLHLDYEESINQLSDAEAGQLLKAIFTHENPDEGEPDHLTGSVKMAYSFIKTQLDREKEAYENKCANLRANARKKYEKENVQLDANASKSMQLDANAVDKEEDEVEDEDKVEDKVEDEVKIDNDFYNTLSLSQATSEGETDSDLFEIFWNEYPKKTGKSKALRAWKKTDPDVELFKKIMAAVRTAKRSDEWIRENGRFIPYPAKWITDKRWEDCPDISARPPTVDPNIIAMLERKSVGG